MKIAIDTSSLLINPNCGLSEVIYNLASELPLVEDGNQFMLFYNYFRSKKKLSNNNFPGTSNHILRVPRRLLKMLWKYDLPYFATLLPKADIYHSLHIQIPPSNQLKKILTVHDCRFLALPNFYPKKEVKNYSYLMNLSLKRADLIVAVSNHTRLEILKHFSISEDRIRVILNGFRPYHPAGNKHEKRVQDFIINNKLPKDYLIYIGVLDARKNLENLINALFNLKKEEKDCPDLVIAGISINEWYKSTQYKDAAKKNLLSNIHIVGTVEKDVLYGILEKALALCYPSLYEGFGFPPLEAMSQRVPVLAGNNSSIPEVTGNAACLVDVLSVEDMVNGLRKIIFNNGYRQKLIEKGLMQVQKFSWPKAAEKYVQLYKEVLG